MSSLAPSNEQWTNKLEIKPVIKNETDSKPTSYGRLGKK
jgi:hypothetical protein